MPLLGATMLPALLRGGISTIYILIRVQTEVPGGYGPEMAFSSINRGFEQGTVQERF